MTFYVNQITGDNRPEPGPVPAVTLTTPFITRFDRLVLQEPHNDTATPDAAPGSPRRCCRSYDPAAAPARTAAPGPAAGGPGVGITAGR